MGRTLKNIQKFWSREFGSSFHHFLITNEFELAFLLLLCLNYNFALNTINADWCKYGSMVITTVILGPIQGILILITLVLECWHFLKRSLTKAGT